VSRAVSAFVLSAFFGWSGNAVATEPDVYSQVLSALTTGREVAVTVQFDLCKHRESGAPGPAVTGGTRIQDFLIPNKQYIAFSTIHDTLNSKNERTTEIIRYRVMPDGTTSVRTATVLFRGGSLLMEADYVCTIGKGVQFHWPATGRRNNG